MNRKLPTPMLVTIIAAQVGSCVFAWRDLARRSDDEVRGRKNLWRAFVTINPGNSAVYWIAGRR